VEFHDISRVSETNEDRPALSATEL